MEHVLQWLKEQIDMLTKEKAFVTIAIDGNCTAGKTTLCGKLAQLYDCNLFHMDDFFLRPEQRTPQRFAEIGGNVDYERFYEEVLVPLKSGNGFSYRPFDCSTFTLSGPVAVVPKKLNIIEGSYSLHPYFNDPYDLSILLRISPELQRQRVLLRPASLHQRFFTQWIPMENAYFSSLEDRISKQEIKAFFCG